MRPEREDGTPLVRDEIKLPKVAKHQTVWAYYQALTMEQAMALTVVAKVSKRTPEAVIKGELAKHGLTVYPKGNAPDPNAPPAEAPLPLDPGHHDPVPLDPRVQYDMAPVSVGSDELGAAP